MAIKRNVKRTVKKVSRDLKKASNNEINNIISKFEVGLPQNRIISVVKKIKNNRIFLQTLNSQIQLNFQTILQRLILFH